MNKTIKIIDLLNKIANGEEVPEKIKKSWLYEWKYDDIREEYCYMQDNGDRFDGDWLIGNILKEEIEIIEDNDKLEKIPHEFNLGYINTNDKDLVIKEMNKTINGIYVDMNKVIDHINKIEEKLDEK